MRPDAELVILSLLAERPSCGDDLDRRVDRRDEQRTPRLHTTAGDALTRLHVEGLVEPEDGPAGRETVYRLTEEGRRVLRRAAAERLARPAPPFSGVLPQLGACASLDDPDLQAALGERVRALTEQIAWLQEARSRAGTEHARALVDHELARQRADLAWTRLLLGRGRGPQSDPAGT